MGSFELADQVGIDVGYHVLEYMHEELGDAYEPCPLLGEKVEADDLGRKTGKGFYDYEDGEGVRIPTDEIRDEVKERVFAIMANEVAGLVENDVADPGAIDRAMQLGAGYPDGPAKLADEHGLDSLVEKLDALREETGEERYEAVGLLRELAENGEGFHGSAGDGAATTDGYDYDSLRVEVEDRDPEFEGE